MHIDITKKQKAFIDSKCDETLFGGAAGGGKSYGQLVDALLYALKYPKSKQLILRRTFPELEKSGLFTIIDLGGSSKVSRVSGEVKKVKESENHRSKGWG